MITIVDYGVGNLSSIRNMLAKVGREEVCITNDHALIASAEKLILPGVGAFDHGMANLKRHGMVETLNEAVLRKGTPVLGICLGMQLLCRRSEEGVLPGLGWIDAKLRRLPSGVNLKVPHMGWNTIKIVRDSKLVEKADGEQRFYFVHSYFAECADPSDVCATAYHGREFAAVFNRGNIFGVQFHPEKSHRFGLALLKKFVAL